LNELLYFVFTGFLGGLAYVLLKSQKWEDLKKFMMVRRVIIGAIAGFIYFFLWSDYDFPNTIMSFVSGYFGCDFIESLVKRFKPNGKGEEENGGS